MSEENYNQPIDNAAELQQRYAGGERNFRKAYLEKANLQGANLQEANLQEAYLRGAFLKESDLKTANLSAADLQGANLKGAYLELTRLEKADLQGANLQGANLGGAMLMGANLERADLTFADFSDTYMLAQGGSGGANLEGANLKGAELRGANLKGANLSGADLRAAKVKGAYPQGAYYDGQTHFPDGFDPVKLGMQKSSTSSKKSSSSALSLKPTFMTVIVACGAVVLSPVVLIKTWAEANKPKPILTAQSEMSITFEADKPVAEAETEAALKSGRPAIEADVDAKLKSGRPATEADVDALLKSGKPATEADVDALLKGERAPLIPNPKANKLAAKLVDKVSVEANKPKSAGVTPTPVAKVASCPVLVRLINAASPDKPSAVDVSVNGKKVISNVPFSQASRYVSVSPGKLRVQIMQAGTMKMVGTRTFAAAPNSAYSVAVTGPLPGPRGKKLLFDKSPFVISENLSPPKPGKFKGKWYNLSETKEATDLRITKSDAPNVDAARLVKLIPKTAVDYQELKAGTYNFNPLLPNKSEALVNSAYKPAIRVEIAKAKISTGAIFDVFAMGNTLGKGLNSLKLSAASYKTLPRTAAGCVRVQ